MTYSCDTTAASEFTDPPVSTPLAVFVPNLNCDLATVALWQLPLPISNGVEVCASFRELILVRS